MPQNIDYGNLDRSETIRLVTNLRFGQPPTLCAFARFVLRFVLRFDLQPNTEQLPTYCQQSLWKGVPQSLQ